MLFQQHNINKLSRPLHTFCFLFPLSLDTAFTSSTIFSTKICCRAMTDLLNLASWPPWNCLYVLNISLCRQTDRMTCYDRQTLSVRMNLLNRASWPPWNCFCVLNISLCGQTDRQNDMLWQISLMVLATIPGTNNSLTCQICTATKRHSTNA